MKSEEELKSIVVRHLEFLDDTVDPAARRCIESFINGVRCALDE
jgi:hypothetical protein